MTDDEREVTQEQERDARETEAWVMITDLRKRAHDRRSDLPATADLMSRTADLLEKLITRE